MVYINYRHVFSDGSTTTSSIRNLKDFSGISNINNLYRTSMYTGLTSSTTGTIDLRRKTSLILDNNQNREIYESTLYSDLFYVNSGVANYSGRLNNPSFSLVFDTVTDDDALVLVATESYTERVNVGYKGSTDQFSYATSRYIATYTTVSNVDTDICVLSRQYSTGSTVIGRYSEQQYTATGIALTLKNSSGDVHWWTVHQLSSNKLTYASYGYDNLTFSLTDTASYPSKTVTLDTSYNADKSATELLFTASSITLTCAVGYNATDELISADATTVQATASNYSIQLPDYPVGTSSGQGNIYTITDNHYALETSNGSQFYNIYSGKEWASSYTLSIADATETIFTVLAGYKTKTYSWTPASPEVNDFLTSVRSLYNSRYVTSAQELSPYASTVSVNYLTLDNLRFKPAVAEQTTLNLRTIDTSSSVSLTEEIVYNTLSSAGVARFSYRSAGYKFFSTIRDNDATGAFSVYNVTQTATSSKRTFDEVFKTVTCDTYTTVDLSQTIFSRSTFTSRTIYSLAGSTVDFDVAVYTFTDNLTYSSRSASSTIPVQASSTSSNYQVAETVIDKNNYTYLTTFYGSLVGNNISTTSWVNSAIVSTTTDQSWLNKYVDYSATYKTFGYPGAVTTVSLVDYDKISHLASASVSREVSASNTMVSTRSYKDSIINNYSSTTYAMISSTRFYSYTNPYITIDNDYDGYYGSYAGTITVSESGSYQNWIDSSSSSEYNTSEYGTTARISDLIKSSSYVNLYDKYGIQNYYYEYNVDSIWKYEDQVSSTLKNYTTVLATSYTFSYSTEYRNSDYAYTKTSSLAFNSTADRFIYRIGRTSTFSFRNYATETVATYNGSTMGTLSKSETVYTDTYTETSTLAETFISSTADFDYGYETTASETKSSYSGRFINSYSVVNATASEQQNDTLIFVSSNMTVSNYQGTYVTTTFNSVLVKGTATEYVDYYTDSIISYNEVQQETATTFTQYESTTSAAITVTQSIKYTPIYSTVDGVYVTA